MSYQQSRRKNNLKLGVSQKPFRQCTKAELIQETRQKMALRNQAKKAVTGVDGFPKGAKAIEQKRQEMEQKITKLFQLRAAGPWSRDILNGEGIGQLLNTQHMVEVKKILLKIKPKNKGDIEKALKLAENTPQQRFLILSEASMQGPLTSEAFQEYMRLFKQILPNHWKQIYGKRTPSQITTACIKQMPEQRTRKK